MDAFIVSTIVKKSLAKKKREHLNDTNEEVEEVYNEDKSTNMSIGTFLLMLIINSYAAYLSWECNTRNNYPLSLKILFSFFAFSFGSLYILYYILFRFDMCNTFVLNPDGSINEKLSNIRV